MVVYLTCIICLFIMVLYLALRIGRKNFKLNVSEYKENLMAAKIEQQKEELIRLKQQLKETRRARKENY